MYENKFTEDALDIFSRLQNSFRNICLTLINGDRLSYTKNQLINYDKQRIDSEDYTVTIGNTYISMSEEKIINSKLNSFKMWKCNAGYDYLYINFNGDLYPCQTYMMNKSIPIGNIQNFDFMHLKQQVCKYDFCQCGLDIRKNKVFKRYR